MLCKLQRKERIQRIQIVNETFIPGTFCLHIHEAVFARKCHYESCHNGLELYQKHRQTNLCCSKDFF
jgi:hypothetical protein